eukprot:tig00020531_g10029.t1
MFRAEREADGNTRETWTSWAMAGDPNLLWAPDGGLGVEEEDLVWVGIPLNKGKMYKVFYAKHHLFYSKNLSTEKLDSSFFSFIDFVPQRDLCDANGAPLMILPVGRKSLLTADEIREDPDRQEAIRRYARAHGLFEFRHPRDSSCTFRIIRADVYALPTYLPMANLDRVNVAVVESEFRWVWPEWIEPWRANPFPDYEYEDMERVVPHLSVEQIIRAQQSFPSYNPIL